MSQAQASRQDLIDAVNWIQESQQRILGIQKQLDTAGVELAASWGGEGHYGFQQAHLLWHQRMDKILQSLTRLAEGIQESNKNYDLFNQERTEAAKRISNMINAESSFA